MLGNFISTLVSLDPFLHHQTFSFEVTLVCELQMFKQKRVSMVYFTIYIFYEYLLGKLEDQCNNLVKHFICCKTSLPGTGFSEMVICVI